MPTHDEFEDFYRRYLHRCNGHQFEQLGQFVADDVAVNGAVQGLRGYIAGLQTVVRAFPDYQWDLRHLLIDGCWLSAHFVDTGTHKGTFLGVAATGRVVSTHEFAVYRVHERKTVEVWVTADNMGLLAQLR